MMKKIISIVLIFMIMLMVACGGKEESDISEKIQVPNTLDAYIGKDYNIAYNDFVEAGFSNIETKEIKDIDAESEIEEGCLESIAIDGVSDFTKDTVCVKESEVIITYHTLVDYHVQIHIDFPKNLLLNKYDVSVYVDDIYEETLEHGKSGDIEMELSMGEHVIAFEKEAEEDDDDKVTGKVTLDVKNDLEAEYQIGCESDEIIVSTNYVDYKVELEEGQSKITRSAEEYRTCGENYKNVISELQKMGFTNIKENVLYDIVFGVTDDGELESVTIDGNENFTKGNIFNSNAEVIVSYHTLEENDPEQITEEESAEQNEEEKTEEKVITRKNSKEFKDILEIQDTFDPSIKEFALEHIGDTVSFNGCVGFMMSHEEYKTRFDVMLKYGDYDNAGKGAQFAFINVSFGDMNVDGADTVKEGMNFKIKGTISGYNDDGAFIELEPVSMEYRD